jgi:hypothetical protein
MLGRVPGWLSRLFPAKTLAGIREPTAVRVDARVLSPNTLVSPITGHTAALIFWRFYTHYTDYDRQTPAERHQPIGACGRGADLHLGTPHGTVLVPALGRTIRPAVAGGGLPLEVSPPPEATFLAQSFRGLVFYDELLLRNGEPVRLRAFVAPSSNKQGSAYRSGGGDGSSDFEVIPHLGPVVVEDVLFSRG